MTFRIGQEILPPIMYICESVYWSWNSLTSLLVPPLERRDWDFFLFEIDGLRGARAHIMEENRKEIIAWRASTRAGEDGEWIRKEQQHGKRREENILFWVSTRREEVGGEKEGETNLQHNKSYKTWKNRTSCFLSNFFSLSFHFEKCIISEYLI